ncbi:unnamed protein product [Prunus brigantina]
MTGFSSVVNLHLVGNIEINLHFTFYVLENYYFSPLPFSLPSLFLLCTRPPPQQLLPISLHHLHGKDLEIVLVPRNHPPMHLHHLQELNPFDDVALVALSLASVVLRHRKPPRLLNLLVRLHVFDLSPASDLGSSIPI